MVQDLAQRAGLPMPRVYLIDEDAPNAFATGRNPEHAAVAATTGILRVLSERELRGVMAHELAHVQHRDILISTVSATMAGAISMLANFAMIFGGRDSEGRPANPIVGLLVMLLAPLAASLIQMAISRAREFEADRGGAEISGDPRALASALREDPSPTRSGIPMEAAERHPETAQMMIMNPLSGGGLRGLFSTHPATEERVAAPAGDGARRPSSAGGGRRGASSRPRRRPIQRRSPCRAATAMRRHLAILACSRRAARRLRHAGHRVAREGRRRAARPTARPSAAPAATPAAPSRTATRSTRRPTRRGLRRLARDERLHAREQDRGRCRRTSPACAGASRPPKTVADAHAEKRPAKGGERQGQGQAEGARVLSRRAPKPPRRATTMRRMTSLRALLAPPRIPPRRARHVDVAPGIAAWGLVTGVAMVKSGLSVPLAVLMSLTVFAGSAQLAVAAAAGQPARRSGWSGPPRFCVNLRFVIFSAQWRPYFGRLPRAAAAGASATCTADLNYRAVHARAAPSRSAAPGQVPLLLGRRRDQLAGLAGAVDGRHLAGRRDPDALGPGLRRHAGAAGPDLLAADRPRHLAWPRVVAGAPRWRPTRCRSSSTSWWRSPRRWPSAC